MACPAASSSINMQGIARENYLDDYNSGTTPTRPYAIFDLVVGGQVSGSGVSFDDINSIGGYGGAGDPPGNEVSFSHFWGYDHDYAVGWTTTPSDYGNVDTHEGSDPGVSSDAQWVLTNGSGDTTVTFVKVSGDTMVSPQFAAATSAGPSNWTNAGSTITISSHTSGNLFVRVRHSYSDRPEFFGAEATYRVTVTNNSVSDTCDATLRITGA